MKHIVLGAGILCMVIIAAYILLRNEVAAPESALQPPNTTTPTATPPVALPAELVTHITDHSDRIVLQSPAPLETISSPVIVTGRARGMWFFEASFPVSVVDWDGRIIGEGIATAEGDWMTESFVPFSATISYTLDPDAYSNKGALILKRDNPSGLPEHDDALEIPVILE